MRVFQQKVHDFCKYLSTRQLFDAVTRLLYTIEFQKRGLPHCHTLLWVDDKDKIHHATDIDRYISAELPDPKTDPEGYRVISETMVHDPCGPADPNSSCMKEDMITFRDRQPLQFIANNDGKKMTTFTEWLEFNKFNE
nr:DNA helicase [Tanacetum cinerariifolium]